MFRGFRMWRTARHNRSIRARLERRDIERRSMDMSKEHNRERDQPGQERKRSDEQAVRDGHPCPPPAKQLASPPATRGAYEVTARASGLLSMSRAGWWYLAVFAFALLVRSLYLFELRDSVLLSVLMVDALGYDEWARQIAGGNWFGSEVFYQAPFYPYFLASIYYLFGHSLWAVRIVQILLGSASCLLVTVAGRRFFSLEAGVVAGAILALYAPAIFFDALVQKAVLGLFFTTLLLALLGQVSVRARWWWLVLSGMVMGCFALTRENALILIPVVVVWLLLRSSTDTWFRRVSSVVLLAVGIGAVLVPIGFRNQAIGGEFLLTTSQLGPNFYIGNNEDADGRTKPMRPRRDDPMYERQDSVEIAEEAIGRKLTPAEVSDYWLDRSMAYIRSQPGHWVRLMVKKWFLVWNRTEIMDAEAIEAYKGESVLLGSLGWVFNFGVLCPFAAVGVWTTRSHLRRIWLLYLILFAVAASIAIFFVNARYRMPIVPILALLAAAGLLDVLARLRDREFKPLSACAVLFVAAALAANVPNVAQATPEAITYANIGTALARDGNHAEAHRYYTKALELIPALEGAHYGIGRMAADQGRLDEAAKHLAKAIQLRPDYIAAYNELGVVLRKQGKPLEAARLFEKAIELYPQYADAYNNLGNVRKQLGEHEQAIRAYEKAIEMDPDHVEAHFNLALTLAPMGRFDEAREHLEFVVRLKPDNAEAHRHLGRVLGQLGRVSEARAHLETAVGLDPGNADAHTDLGRVLAAQGDLHRARVEYEEALRIDPAHAQARRLLESLPDALQNVDEARLRD